MKVYKLFTMAMAAMAFAACSDNDVIDDQKLGDQTPDNWEANMEGLTINFGTATGPTTRDYSGETPSEGTEAMIYDAYVFAREANPGHQNPLEGDWTVIKCKVNDESKIVEGESQVTNPDGTKTLKNVATFHGVRQGDMVYVIANDPNMTLDLANSLAHQGTKSEDKIKNYTSILAKEYLGGLNFGAKVTKPEGKFIMGGMAQIPVAPTLPSNGTLELEVGLDRELSKVLFQANVTATPSDAAYQLVEFRQGDGIVVARIAPTTSMFSSDREANFYVPVPSCTENWPINDHSLVEGVFSKLCDQTIEGSKMFDGMYVTDAAVEGRKVAQVWNGMNLADKFNMTNPAGDVQEYRYSWILPEGTAVGSETVYGTQTENLVYGNTKSLYASTFYTTPNYGANVNGTTVICTQATYIGKDEFMNNELNKVIEKVLTYNEPKIEFKYGTEAKDVETVANPLFVENSTASTDDEKLKENKENTDKFLASLKRIIGYDSKKTGAGLGMKYLPKVLDEKGKEAPKDFSARVEAISGIKADDLTFYLKASDGSYKELGLAREQYEDIMDKFYQALILHYRASQPYTNTVIGDMLTELGNKVMAGRKAYFYDPALMAENASNPELITTDYLLLGNAKDAEYQLYTKKKPADPVTRAFDYSGYDKNAAKTSDTPIFCLYDQSEAEDGLAVTFTSTDFTKGKAARLDYFASADAFKYFTNMKLYYRADVANYVGNTSNKITERNMYYRTIGTIQTLGARTIHDAIYSEENTMKVNVTVNKWKLSINQIPM